jgi:hypothetical protein
MKTILSLVAFASLIVLTGCGGDNSHQTAASTNSASSGNPLDAPGDYLKALGKSQQSAVKTVDTTSLDKAIQMFNVDQGRNPRDLNELVEKRYIPKIPDTPYGMKLVYDANSGSVKVAPQ